MKSSPLGRWRRVEMEQWDQDYMDMVSPGHVMLKKGGAGHLHFGCVDAEVDWRFEADAVGAEV